MRYAIFAGVVSLGLMVSAAQAQEEYKQDVTVSALGAFMKSTNGNGIDQTGENSAGVLFSYRYFFTNHQGVELNYAFTPMDQSFSPVSTNLNPTFAPVTAASDMHEATASYVYRFAAGHRITPFVSAGTGALVFTPGSGFLVNAAGGSNSVTADFVYGGGADVAFSKHLSLRLGYRGHVFSAPDFGIAAIKTGSVTHMAEPFGGLSFHF